MNSKFNLSTFVMQSAVSSGNFGKGRIAPVR